MKVSDLAADLEVPASTILAQCQRFGIDATWAGAELSGSDVVVLRAELATEDPIDLTGADDPAADPTPQTDAEPAVHAAGAEASAQGEVAVPPAPVVPPTAVGSMPELLDEITPEPEPEPAAPNVRAGGFAMAGAEGMATDPGAPRPPRPKDAPVERRLERSVRRSIVALVAAVAFFVASNYTELAAVVAVLWLFTAVALLVAFVDGFRGRRRVQTHPERLHGVVLGTLSVVLAIGDQQYRRLTATPLSPHSLCRPKEPLESEVNRLCAPSGERYQRGISPKMGCHTLPCCLKLLTRELPVCMRRRGVAEQRECLSVRCKHLLWHGRGGRVIETGTHRLHC